MSPPDMGNRSMAVPDMLADIDKGPHSSSLSGQSGVLPRQDIRKLVQRRMIRSHSGEFVESQFQPASIDLRLGHKAYRVRASFLPGSNKRVEEALADPRPWLTAEEVSARMRAHHAQRLAASRGDV